MLEYDTPQSHVNLVSLHWNILINSTRRAVSLLLLSSTSRNILVGGSEGERSGSEPRSVAGNVIHVVEALQEGHSVNEVQA